MDILRAVTSLKWKNSTASYEITKVTPATEGDYNTLLDGNLTIKELQNLFSSKRMFL
jgi:hypothetical protein